MSTQTSKKQLPEVATQTSRKQLPEMATQTSKRFLPALGPTTSCLKPTPPTSKPPAQRRKLRFKIVTHCEVEDPSNGSVRAKPDSKRESASCLVKDRHCLKESRVSELSADENVMLMDEVSECSTCEASSVQSASEFSDCSSCMEREAAEMSEEEKIVTMEEEALAMRLEKEKKRYHEAMR